MLFRTLRNASLVAAVFFLFLLGIWGGLALYFRAPGPELIRVILAFLLAGAVAYAISGLIRKRYARLSPALAAVPAVVLWWNGILPSNERPWADDVARPAVAEIAGAKLQVSNLRNFRWRSEEDVTRDWEVRTYDLNRLTSVDLFTVHWAGEKIAHTLVSFGFSDGRRLIWSAELRRIRGQTYKTVESMFKLSELILIAGDERDLIGVRAQVRQEDVRLYPLKLSPEAGRSLLRAYAQAANELAATPRWYNAVTANCTTIVFDLAKMLDPGARYDWRVLLSGYLPEYAWDYGAIDNSVPFETWRARASVTARAQKAPMETEEAFSSYIRE